MSGRFQSATHTHQDINNHAKSYLIRSMSPGALDLHKLCHHGMALRGDSAGGNRVGCP
jgi:hypothetical protein